MARDYGLSSKVAIVTGEGKGIGRAIALSLAECGAKLAIASRSKDELNNDINIYIPCCLSVGFRK